ncbi:MAG: hypothetical protein R2784_16665 [Saprospiraceae bacterium]
MSIFKKIFGDKNQVLDQPDIDFGRFTDSYKSAEQYAAWDKSLLYFEQDDYLDSFKEFFKYLVTKTATMFAGRRKRNHLLRNIPRLQKIHGRPMPRN